MADNLNLSSNIDIQEAWTGIVETGYTIIPMFYTCNKLYFRDLSVVQHFVKKNSFDLDILKPIHKIIDEAKDLDETRAATTKKLNAEKVAADLKKAKFEADLAAAHEARRRFHRYDPSKG